MLGGQAETRWHMESKSLSLCVNKQSHYIHASPIVMFSTMWAYLGSITEVLVNIQKVLQRSPSHETYSQQTLRSSKRRRALSHSTRPPVANPIGKNFSISHIPGEEGQQLLAVLEYLTEAIVPLLHAFYTSFFDPKEGPNGQEAIELEVSAAIANALFVSDDVMIIISPTHE